MGRKLRLYAPGVPFHITARVALKQQLFADEKLRHSIVNIAAESLARSDAELKAFCVMPNHLHLVAIQGIAPLSQLMQGMLRRMALRVQKHYLVSGRIFDGNFFATPCADARYFRTAIVYTHLNPCRKGLVERAEEYVWSSHHLYAGLPHGDPLSALITPSLDLFAASDDDIDRPDGYLKHVDYRLRRDECKRAGVARPTDRPSSLRGDELWVDRYASRIRSLEWHVEKRLDLRDLAKSIADQFIDGDSLAHIRGPGKTRLQALVRHRIADAASRAGYSGHEIARFLGISESRVSQILTACRAIRPIRQQVGIRVKR